MKKCKLLLTAAAVACLLLSAAAGLPAPPAAAQENARELPFSVGAGVDFPTAYFFRGLLNEDQGFIAQPYANLYWNLYESGELSVIPWVGIWNSFHENQEPGTSNHYFELDLLAGVDVGIGPLTFGTAFIYYNSPADAFRDIHEVEFKLSYDDSELAEAINFPFSLSPYFKFDVETQDEGGTEDTYFEIGLGPSFEVDVGEIPVTIGFPVTIGMSVDDYYVQNDGSNAFLGYVSTAVTASFALPLPEEAGSWALTLRGEYLYLDADSLRAANKGDSDELIGMIGVSVEF